MKATHSQLALMRLLKNISSPRISDVGKGARGGPNVFHPGELKDLNYNWRRG